MDFYGVTQEKVVARERERIEDVAIERTRPIQMLSRLRALFSCVGMFGAEILGDAGQRKWVTWNYVTNFRQLLHPCQPKKHHPDLQDVRAKVAGGGDSWETWTMFKPGPVKWNVRLN